MGYNARIYRLQPLQITAVTIHHDKTHSYIRARQNERYTCAPSAWGEVQPGTYLTMNQYTWGDDNTSSYVVRAKRHLERMPLRVLNAQLYVRMLQNAHDRVQCVDDGLFQAGFDWIHGDEPRGEFKKLLEAAYDGDYLLQPQIPFYLRYLMEKA